MTRALRYTFVAACMALSISLAACASKPSAPQQTTANQKAAEDTPKKAAKDSLVIVQATETRDLSTIDPLQKDNTLPRSMVFDTLFVRSADGKLAPSLAESFEIKGNVLKIKLRSGVAFHNGDALTAESVKATLDKILDKNVKTSYASGFADVTEVKVIDAANVEIVTKAPNHVLPSFLAEMPILSAKQLADGDKYKNELNGTGPYTLAEWKRGESVTLKSNPKYWGARPVFQQVVIKYVPDENARIAELLSGKADVAGDIPPAAISRIKDQKGFRVVSEPGIRVTWVSYNFKPPFDNQKFRQAIYYGIDRAGLAKNLFGEFASPAVSPVSKGGAGYVEVFPLSDFNVDKAKKLVADSGVKTPVTVDLDVRKTDSDIAQIVQAQLKQIGVETRINIIDPGTFFDPKRYESRSSGSIILSTSFDNPEKDVYRLFGPAYSASAFYMRFGYKPLPEHDTLIKQYVAEPDAAKRMALAKQVLESAKEDASVLWLMHPSNLYGVSDAIDWTPNGTGRIDIHQIKVK